MPPVRTSLFAGDLSENSQQAFRVACALAHESKTRLYVLHVVEETHVAEQAVACGEFGIAVLPDAGASPRREALGERLRERYAPSHPIDVEYLVRDGAAAEEILRVADEVGADLIVLGTHGRTGLRRLLLGSVAEAVLRRAQCPVLALRSSDDARAPEAIGAILHPTDLSKSSEGALRVARELARDTGARLVLLHVAPQDVVAPRAFPMLIDLQAFRDSLEVMREVVDGPDLKSPVEAQLRQGNPAVEILNAAQETGCDLIVMGSHGRSGLGRVLTGSVAEAVLRQAGCPVLMVKASVAALERAAAAESSTAS